jgi:O-antigen ligase
MRIFFGWQAARDQLVQSVFVSWHFLIRMQCIIRNWHLCAFGLCLFFASFFLLDKLHIHRLIYYCVVLIPFAVAFDPVRTARVMRSPVWWLAVCHVLYLWLSLAWSGQAQWADWQRVGWQVVCLVSFLTILPCMLLDEPKLVAWLSRSIVAAAVVAGIYSILAHVGGSGGGRLVPIGLATHPIIAGAAYGVAAVTAASGLVRPGRPVRERILFAAALIILVAVVVLTKSRGPMLGLAVTFSLMAVVQRGRTAILVLAAGIVVFAGLEFSGMIDAGRFIGRADSHRFELWTLYLDLIAQRPVLGFGVSVPVEVVLASGTVIEHPHNLLLSSQVYGGVIAALLLVALIAAAFVAAFRALRAGSAGLPLWLLTFILVTGNFDFGHLVANAGWEWLSFWLPVGLAGAADLRTKSNMRD